MTFEYVGFPYQKDITYDIKNTIELIPVFGFYVVVDNVKIDNWYFEIDNFKALYNDCITHMENGMPYEIPLSKKLIINEVIYKPPCSLKIKKIVFKGKKIETMPKQVNPMKFITLELDSDNNFSGPTITDFVMK